MNPDEPPQDSLAAESVILDKQAGHVVPTCDPLCESGVWAQRSSRGQGSGSGDASSGPSQEPKRAYEKRVEKAESADTAPLEEDADM